ncbi:neuroligin-4, X-linked isoform X2 [Chrysoperla carnea]|nr:neuroligin-4, X-linked isoform X2 [Chrysoperla carnea]
MALILINNKIQFTCDVKKLIFWINLWCFVCGQVDPGGRYRNRAGVYVDPGERGYSTFVYKDRRYGTYQPNAYGNQYSGQDPYANPVLPPGSNPYNAQEQFEFNQNQNDPQRVYLPGVLGGWRPDLQGKQRQDSITLPRDIFVNTNYGQVQGFKVYIYDDPRPESGYRPMVNVLEKIRGTCHVFLGIPYAMPPINEGRFKPPRPHKSWQQIQAVDYGPACPQPNRYTGATKGINDMDEDCLYLNVFTPSIESRAQKYPVMVYIHGGEFTYGASNTFPGHIMATFYNVVIVTINYRLGALGFLSTADVNSPGNYGILDQAMALRWIHDNVEAFNGDRNSITLFGPDAGAASAGLLMVAPETRDLVTGVIAQSGSAVADWAFIVDRYRAQNTSKVFGLKVGCSIESSWKLINCLKRSRHFSKIGNAELNPDVGTFPWGPVLDQNLTMPEYDGGWRKKDWVFLKETPEELIKKGHFNPNLRYMSGVTTQEAAFFIKNNKTLDPYYEVDEDFFHQKIMEHVLRYNYTLNPLGVYEAIKYMYTYWPDPHNKTHFRDQYIKMLSDFLYVAPHDKMAKLLLEKNVPVYLYVLNTTVESLGYDYWHQYTHNIEHLFLTGAPFMDEEFFPKIHRINRYKWTNNDRNMSHFFMKAYTDFARYGNPSQQQILGLHFERARPGFLKYLNINTTYNSTILWDYRQTESAFWSYYLQTVIGRLVPTYPPITEIWWEPKQPLQIAFWSVSATCLLLVVMVVVCCMLWRSAKR